MTADVQPLLITLATTPDVNPLPVTLATTPDVNPLSVSLMTNPDVNPIPVVFVYAGIDSYTKALLHFNGADGSVVFRDESGKTWTPRSNAQLDTDQKKFGLSSGLFDGVGDTIDTPYSTDFSMGSGDFTFEAWIRIYTLPPLNTYYIVFDWGPFAAAQNIMMGITNQNGVKNIFFYDNNSSTNYYAPYNYIANTWIHLAWVRFGNVLTIYVNGIAIGNKALVGSVSDAGAVFSIGGDSTQSYCFIGWIDEARISKGTARWTADFTPPTNEY